MSAKPKCPYCKSAKQVSTHGVVGDQFACLKCQTTFTVDTEYHMTIYPEVYACKTPRRNEQRPKAPHKKNKHNWMQ